MRLLCCLLFMCFISGNVIAQNQESYIYLEGIKGIPYKVMLNGIEIEQLGRNYVLMPSTKEGENTIEIKFGGELYPTQNFVIDVRNQSSYGYKLAKASEDHFYLLDLVNNGKIIETNSDVNIGLSTEDNLINFAQRKEAVPVVEANKLKAQLALQKAQDKLEADKARQQLIDIARANELKNREEKRLAKDLKKEQEKLAKEQARKAVEQARIDEADRIEKENQRKLASAKRMSEEFGVVEIIKPKEENATNIASSVATTKCATIASKAEIASFEDRLKQKSDDETKLILVKKKIFTGCITVNQLLHMSEIFETQYGRFSVIKFLYPELSDAENIVQLESLFRYDSYKSKLKKM